MRHADLCRPGECAHRMRDRGVVRRHQTRMTERDRGFGEIRELSRDRRCARGRAARGRRSCRRLKIGPAHASDFSQRAEQPQIDCAAGSGGPDKSNSEAARLMFDQTKPTRGLGLTGVNGQDLTANSPRIDSPRRALIGRRRIEPSGGRRRWVRVARSSSAKRCSGALWFMVSRGLIAQPAEPPAVASVQM